MSSQRFTGRPEYETMELLLDIVRKATYYRLYRARHSDILLSVHRGVPFGRVLLCTQNLPQRGALL